LPKFPDTKKNSGAAGEEEAARYLRRRGYDIVERNLRLAGSEIDIVARRGDILAFVEVKTRRTSACGAAVEFVSVRKRQKLIRAAKLFMTRRSYAALQPRLDIIAVTTHEALGAGSGIGASPAAAAIEHYEGAIEE